jgi:hypothetical protein
LTGGADCQTGGSTSWVAISKTFGYTWGSDRVHAHGFTNLSAEGTATTVPSAF